jgi:diadenosine tetraphosphate (Ap4A) HIT family hydrolase
MEKARIRQHINKPGICVFCEYNSSPENIIRTYRHFLLIPNLFPYVLWDGCKVTDHLLLMPTRHIESLSELTAQESAEYVQIVSSLEDDGYAIYARPAGSAGKSIPHQHTHLIRIDNNRIKSLYYSYMPHVLWFK